MPTSAARALRHYLQPWADVRMERWTDGRTVGQDAHISPGPHILQDLHISPLCYRTPSPRAPADLVAAAQ